VLRSEGTARGCRGGSVVAGPEEEEAGPVGSCGAVEVGITSVDWLVAAANGSEEEMAFGSKAAASFPLI
jgi:hypothetical protein